MAELERARAAKERLRAQLAGRRGIAGIGITRTDDGFGLQVNVAAGADGAGLPATINGVAVRVQLAGTIVPLRAGA
ncbi:hypothetical protein [Pengzhenrongella sicca]|uniref:Uncharacterized protein n=1 Tax=Pengzhenrongella sicca TaxID=2819238 RepID=A0A8A4ZET9_9MICO|nr:hypothetical protein [Pengzhenrongella sicca]QTE29433.1 hypothetical protein J4E96_19585 [Pengzhenrongella sicca]